MNTSQTLFEFHTAKQQEPSERHPGGMGMLTIRSGFMVMDSLHQDNHAIRKVKEWDEISQWLAVNQINFDISVTSVKRLFVGVIKSYTYVIRHMEPYQLVECKLKFSHLDLNNSM